MESSNTVLDGGAIEAVAKLAIRGESIDVTEIGGRTFTDKPIHRVNVDPDLPKPLEFYTLAAFRDYLLNEPTASGFLVHVVSPTRAEAVSVLEGGDKHLRRVIAVAECKTGPVGFRYNNPVSLEELSIALQTCFAPERGVIENLRKFCASVKSTAEIGVADDGVSQEVQARRGIAAVQSTPVNNPWQLAPWRTFAEVDQPVSPFVLRFSQGEEGRPEAGLYETGNAQWKSDAVSTIAKWLRNGLPSFKVLG